MYSHLFIMQSFNHYLIFQIYWVKNIFIKIYINQIHLLHLIYIIHVLVNEYMF